MSHTAEWRSWDHMKRRCLDPGNDAYEYYGGRGITVHEPWIGSFELFFAYMGRKPGPKYSIDRINNDGNYEPGNVRWATPLEQARNQRKPQRPRVPGGFGAVLASASSRRVAEAAAANGSGSTVSQSSPGRAPSPPPTECPNGHRYDEENTYIRPAGRRECRKCRKARKAAWDRANGSGRTWADRKKPRCKHGHDYTPENTYITKKGARACRECMRETGRRTKERNREAVRARNREYAAHRRAEAKAADGAS